MHDPYCDHLVDPNPWALALSIFLVVGILVSYLPQHFKIITNGTSAGLSPWWVLLGTLSSIAGLTNIIVLPTSQHDMACCKEISAGECASAMLGIVQVGVQWTCFMGIMVLFVIYFPRKTDLAQSEALPDNVSDDLPNPKAAVTVAVSVLVALLFAGIGSLAFLVAMPRYLLGWANFLGIIASIMASIQYLPQIWTTYRLGQVLSLSIVTMLIQVPGAFVFAFSLWLRVRWQGWSTWLVYIVTAILQTSLLVMAIQFWIRDRNNAREDQRNHPNDSREPDERDPLLPRASTRALVVEEGNTLRTMHGDATRKSLDAIGHRPEQDHSPHNQGSET